MGQGGRGGQHPVRPSPTLTSHTLPPPLLLVPSRSSVRLNVCGADLEFAFGDKPFFASVISDVRRGVLG
jgi:hypothetical protein